jgi:succinoglycan biosynthesis transport protein ExoP
MAYPGISFPATVGQSWLTFCLSDGDLLRDATPLNEKLTTHSDSQPHDRERPHMTLESTHPEDLSIDMGLMLSAVLARALRIVFVTVLLLAATYAFLLFVPRMYESTAGLLVEQRSNALARTANEQSPQPSIPVEAMMSSQVELIKSRDTLLEVIDSENLRSVAELTNPGFSPLGMIMQLLGRRSEPRGVDEQVLGNLYDNLTVARERDSAVISVRYRARDPELAARIANAIAEAHVRRRAQLSLADTAEASDWLLQEIERLRVGVRQAEDAVAEYRVQNDLFAGANNVSIGDQQLSAIAAQITAAQERKNAALSRANLIRGLLEAGQPIDGVENVRASVVIQQLSQSLANLQGELAQRSSTLLPNHPTIKALRAQIAEIQQQINLEGRRVAEALEAEARIEANLEQSLNDELARGKLNVSDATRDTVALQALEREAKAQRDLLETYLLKYSDAISRTDASSALPDVRVVTLAAPSMQPASPKTGLILAAVGFVAVAVQVGGVLFGELMSGRALATRRRFDETIDATPIVYTEPVADVQQDEGDWGDMQSATDADARREGATTEDPLIETADSESADDGQASAVRAADESAAAHDEDAVTVMRQRDEPAVAEDRLAPAAAVFLAAAAARDGMPEEEQEPLLGPDGDADLEEFDSPPGPELPDGASELRNLSADMAIGRVRVVLLAGLEGNDDCVAVSDRLVADALRRGLSVACVDAGSGRASIEPGLSDLSADRVSFGDVVHKVGEGLAEVPWGQSGTIARRSMRPLTLLEALTDIYEVVIVTTGRIGLSSALPVFSGIDCRLVLVEGGESAPGRVEQAIEDAAALGFEVAQIVAPPQRQSDVA